MDLIDHPTNQQAMALRKKLIEELDQESLTSEVYSTVTMEWEIKGGIIQEIRTAPARNHRVRSAVKV